MHINTLVYVRMRTERMEKPKRKELLKVRWDVAANGFLPGLIKESKSICL